MRRREFIAALGGAAALSNLWPPAAHAQQAMPVIGYLGLGSQTSGAQMMTVFRQTLAEAGYIDGRSVTIEPRWAEGDYSRLPELAADLVRRQVTIIIATGGTAPALAAKAATTTIPIVFSVTDDPVKIGLVASFARPGGNATGVHFLLSALGTKQLGLLREVVPKAARLALMVNPNNANAEPMAGEVTTAAAAIGMRTEAVRAGNSREIDAAFAALVQSPTDALIVASDPLFYSRRQQIVALAASNAIPAIYNVREFAEAGGLISYGTNLTEVYRQVGTYAGRILKGNIPADLPVVQTVKFELVINQPAARALGIEIPPTLLARADEVIE
jgi:putative ABC transport system substrate-binding protein